jgi:hypothetical protein
MLSFKEIYPKTWWFRKRWRWWRGWYRCLNEHPWIDGLFCKKRTGHWGKHANAGKNYRWR